MTKVILAIGEVSEQQGREVLNALPVHQRSQAQVVHVTFDELFPELCGGSDKEPTTKAIQSHLIQFGTIVCFVMDESARSNWTTDMDALWITPLLNQIPQWVAHPDGRVEYIG